MMELIYPKEGLKIFIPKDLDGSKSTSIFEVAHRRAEAKVYWYLDEDYIGTTKRMHQKEIIASEGIHQINIIDDKGNRIEKKIEFVIK